MTDADDAPLNSVYQISAQACVEHTPYGNGISSASGEYTDLRSIRGYLSGSLTTAGPSEDMKYQMFVSSGPSGGEPSAMYYRSFSSGTWSAWHMVSDQAMPSSSNIAIRKKMIAPFLDAEGNPTAENTGTANPQYMGDDPAIFSDFNDAPRNSIYQIDLDCDPSVMANNPLPGCSSVLITAGFSYSSRHGTIQLCIGLGSGKTRMFYRYGYIQAADDYRWSSWESVVTGSASELTLSAGTEDEITVSASRLREMIDELSEAYGAITTGVLELSPSGIEQGTWSYSHKGDHPQRLRSGTSYKIPYGTKVIYSNPSMRIAFGLMQTPDADSYVQFSEWIEPGSVDTEYTFWDEGYLNIIFESADGAPVTPADYDSTVRIVYP